MLSRNFHLLCQFLQGVSLEAKAALDIFLNFLVDADVIAPLISILDDQRIRELAARNLNTFSQFLKPFAVEHGIGKISVWLHQAANGFGLRPGIFIHKPLALPVDKQEEKDIHGVTDQMQRQCPGWRIKLAAHPVTHAVPVSGIQSFLFARIVRIRNLRDVEIDLRDKSPRAECAQHIPVGANIAGRQNDGLCSAKTAVFPVLAGGDAGYDPAIIIYLQIQGSCLPDDLIAFALQTVFLQDLAHQDGSPSFILVDAFFLNDVMGSRILRKVRTSVLAAEQLQL